MTGKGYREIFETLRREILDGKFDKERTLPSEFGLARRFKVCRPTVSRAMQELVTAGLVVRRQGAPTTLTRFAQNASGCMGLVIQGRWNEHDLYPRVCKRLIARAERSGWKMICCEIFATSKRGRLHEIKKIVDRLTAEQVTGVFFQPVECMSKSDGINSDIVARFAKAGIHVVLLDYDVVRLPLRSDYDVVGVDNFAAGYALATHFLDKGLKRISFLRLPDAAPSVMDREHGIAAAVLARTGRWTLERNVVVCDPSDAALVSARLKSPLPQVLIAYNDSAALALCDSLRRSRRNLGRLKVAGFDDIPEAATANPPLTTMRQDVEGLSRLAFHTLVTRIKSPTLPPRKMFLPCRLVEREA